MSVDAQKVRARCDELSTRELLRTAVVEAHALRPEALAVWREVLDTRVGDLTDYVKGCADSAGELHARLDARNVRAHDASDVYVGELVLSSGGAGFIADAVDDHGMRAADVLGPLLAPLFERLFAGSVAPHSAAPLPLPLLASIYDGVFWYDADAITTVELRDGRIFSVHGYRAELMWCVLEDGATDVLPSWSASIDTAFSQTQGESLWGKIKGIFGGKS